MINSIVEEYIQCKTEVKYMIENHFTRFDNISAKYVPFKLLDTQKNLIDDYEDNRFNIVKKYRQAGLSTSTMAYLATKLVLANVNNPEVIVIVNNNVHTGMRNLDLVRGFLSELPRWMFGKEYHGSEENEKKPIFVNNSKRQIVLPNGSEIKVVSTHLDSLRGYTPTRVVFDEAAFIDKGDVLYEMAMISIQLGGRIILISTPNGMDKVFHKVYVDAVANRNRFNIIDINWYEDPRFNKHLRWVLKDGSGEEIDYMVGVKPKNYHRAISLGYKPTSPWYEQMSMNLNNNSRHIRQEIGAEFVF